LRWCDALVVLKLDALLQHEIEQAVVVDANFAGHFCRFWKLCALGLRNVLSRDLRPRLYPLDGAREMVFFL
jgi:hypothetical protein